MQQLIYSPTDLQRQVRDDLRNSPGVGQFVTDQQIYDAVAGVIAERLSGDHLTILTRARLALEVVRTRCGELSGEIEQAAKRVSAQD
jgi:hypothetical protein